MSDTHTIEHTLKKFWGYDSFFPLQKQAADCAVEGRDSVVVLPTGGGKSLCFQVPAMVLPGLAVVVSPLISLMKDQVDALCDYGIPAARFDSTLSYGDQKAVRSSIQKGKLKLLYLSPERLVSVEFIDILKTIDLSLFAIDEAHCISQWGHNFRPEYRELGLLRETFPGISIHGYTATATEKVRSDIARQLRLKDPVMIVGSFDRPNLVYKVERRSNVMKQVCAVLDKHKNESGVIYCIRRADVDDMYGSLKVFGYNVVPYHAGMDSRERQKNQDAFIEEKVDTIVATVAFGMGIDKSNIRYIIHSGMPKSLEHYHQETGRAGRDNLEADCHLFFTGGDYGIWRSILSDLDSEAKEINEQKLNKMYEFCTKFVCRHNTILQYFGQIPEKDNCAACDVCLGDFDHLEDSLITAQKILSCIKRLDERFGADYTTLVLIGSHEQRIIGNGHDSLSTYGMLSDFPKRIVRDWIEQLVSTGYIKKTDDYNVLTVTEKGWDVLKGTVSPRLLKPAEKPAKISQIAIDSWEHVDKKLFEELRKVRRRIADKKNVPAYIVFGDATLRDMARVKPLTPESFLTVHGVGEVKSGQYCDIFVAAIRDYCGD
ncbi:DNA helicase RecQ [Candidatus Latescibacterota bacterium]